MKTEKSNQTEIPRNSQAVDRSVDRPVGDSVPDGRPDWGADSYARRFAADAAINEQFVFRARLAKAEEAMHRAYYALGSACDVAEIMHKAINEEWLSRKTKNELRPDSWEVEEWARKIDHCQNELTHIRGILFPNSIIEPT